MSNDHEYQIDLIAYQSKLKECKDCIYNLECRGPAPHDISCPNEFVYIPYVAIVEGDK